MAQIFNRRTGSIGNLLFVDDAGRFIVQVFLPSGARLRMGWDPTECEQI